MTPSTMTSPVTRFVRERRTRPVRPHIEPRSRDHLLIAAVALVTGSFYLALPSRNVIYADDSLRFLLSTVGEPTIHPHHLILYLSNLLLRLVDGSTGDIAHVEFIFRSYVAACSALALYLVGAFSLRWFGSLRIAMVSMLSVAFSLGFWSYSIVTDLYVPAVTFVLLSVWFAERAVTGWRPYRYLLAAALSLLVAVYNHQSFSISAVPIVLVLFHRSRFDRRRAWRLTLTFLLATVLPGIGSYYAAMRLAAERDFIRFVLGYSVSMNLTPYDRVQPLTPVYAAIGIVRSIVHPEYALRFDPVFDALGSAFPLKLLFDDRYVVRALPLWIVVAAIAMSIALLVVIARGLWQLPRAIRAGPALPAGYRMLAGSAIVQGLFFIWWEPASNEFWIWLLPWLALLSIGPLLRTGSRRINHWAVLLPGMLLAANLPVVSCYWSERNDIYRINKEYRSAIPSSSLLFTANLYQTSSLDQMAEVPMASIDFPLGAFRMDNSRVRDALRALGRRDGALFLDPMLAMPEPTELRLMKYYAKGDPEGVSSELLKLEDYCRTQGIPLYGLKRKGEPRGGFIRRRFRGHLRWIDGDGGGIRSLAMRALRWGG